MSGNDDSPQILRPLPRRPFDLNFTPASGSDHSYSHPSTPGQGQQHAYDGPGPSLAAQLDARLARQGSSSALSDADGPPPSRSKSILNLTSGALFGIYQATTGDGGRESEPATPWGTGAETPARSERGGAGAADLDWEQLRAAASGVANGARGPAAVAASADKGEERARPGSLLRTTSTTSSSGGGAAATALPLAARAAALFVFGVAYGVIVSHLHDNRHISPVRVEGIPRGHWGYLVFWGVAGVALGSLLPWVDVMWEGASEEAAAQQTKKKKRSAAVVEEEERRKRKAGEATDDWIRVVRSVGAFVGIAFAIRRLPWQSTLQVSLTLALVNPALWYLLDRSKPGFTLSTAVGLSGTAVVLLLGPEMFGVPSPPIVEALNVGLRDSAGGADAGRGGWSAEAGYEGLGAATWFASVLFCSTVCFGNIGRKLAIRR
ncbi:uncharacterized protein K452DRAFT_287816 [Aplosporella prunicola CBS 121167]|uniref:Uncharacterized protein n=1 Tax=Aplosporella prunicola CBS 121167 TaxID=1176127 RepID=A0A6A6BCQ4_9PEZI|nr:uncharacterized protein K452DRAFT_287816 [Aplosporella prunicola CBS 121167]KAF2141846.1 hypothetical protein K452DRAFT_287816 [Aplosporella prunicola CBS 121167]